jgi:hypothetical protein
VVFWEAEIRAIDSKSSIGLKMVSFLGPVAGVCVRDTFQGPGVGVWVVEVCAMFSQVFSQGILFHPGYFSLTYSKIWWSILGKYIPFMPYQEINIYGL